MSLPAGEKQEIPGDSGVSNNAAPVFSSAGTAGGGGGLQQPQIRPQARPFLYAPNAVQGGGPVRVRSTPPKLEDQEAAKVALFVPHKSGSVRPAMVFQNGARNNAGPSAVGGDASDINGVASIDSFDPSGHASADGMAEYDTTGSGGDESPSSRGRGRGRGSKGSSRGGGGPGSGPRGRGSNRGSGRGGGPNGRGSGRGRGGGAPGNAAGGVGGGVPMTNPFGGGGRGVLQNPPMMLQPSMPMSPQLAANQQRGVIQNFTPPQGMVLRNMPMYSQQPLMTSAVLQQQPQSPQPQSPPPQMKYTFSPPQGVTVMNPHQFQQYSQQPMIYQPGTPTSPNQLRSMMQPQAVTTQLVMLPDGQRYIVQTPQLPMQQMQQMQQMQHPPMQSIPMPRLHTQFPASPLMPQPPPQTVTGFQVSPSTPPVRAAQAKKGLDIVDPDTGQAIDVGPVPAIAKPKEQSYSPVRERTHSALAIESPTVDHIPARVPLTEFPAVMEAKDVVDRMTVVPDSFDRTHASERRPSSVAAATASSHATVSSSASSLTPSVAPAHHSHSTSSSSVALDTVVAADLDHTEKEPAGSLSSSVSSDSAAEGAGAAGGARRSSLGGKGARSRIAIPSMSDLINVSSGRTRLKSKDMASEPPSAGSPPVNGAAAPVNGAAPTPASTSASTASVTSSSSQPSASAASAATSSSVSSLPSSSAPSSTVPLRPTPILTNNLVAPLEESRTQQDDDFQSPQQVANETPVSSSFVERPHGPIRYTREFLLGFEKLANLPRLNIDSSLFSDILINSSGGRTPKSTKAADQRKQRLPAAAGKGAISQLTPAASAQSPRPGGRRNPRQTSGRDPRSRTQQSQRYPPSPLPPVEPLQKTEHRWEPGQGMNSEIDKLKRKVQLILNKLTLDKFESLSGQLMKIVQDNVTSLQLLVEVVNVVFDKALSEQHFSAMYADLCKKIQEEVPKFEVKPEDGVQPETPSDKSEQKKAATFRKILLNKCQEEFDRGTVEVSRDGKSEEEVHEEQRLQKSRMLGNIKFIGELYKHKMIAEKIMHDCIQHLLKNIDNPLEEDMEAVCNLLSTIGKKLDHQKASNLMKAYFDRFKSLSSNKSLPSRIRFMCLDLQDLRKNDWVPRRKKVEAKTMEEIQKEHAKELAGAQSPGGSSLRGGAAMRGGRGGGAGVARGALPPTAPRTAEKGRGPPGSQDVRGVHTQKTPPPANSSAAAAASGRTSQDRYAIRSRADSRDTDVAPSTRESNSNSRSRDNSLSVPPGKARKDSTSDRDRDSESEEDRRRSAARERDRSQDTRRGSDVDEEYDEKPSHSNGARSTEDEARSKIRSMIMEYFTARDLKEARLCLDDIAESHASESYQKLVVQEAIQLSVEKKEEERMQTVQLLIQFHKDLKLKTDHFVEALRGVIRDLDEMLVDLPKADHFIAEMVGAWVAAGCMGLRNLAERDIQELLGRHAEAFWATLFFVVCTQEDVQRVYTLVHEVKLDPRQLLPGRADAAIRDWLRQGSLTALFPSFLSDDALLQLLNSTQNTSSLIEKINGLVSNAESQPTFARKLFGTILESVTTRSTCASEAKEPTPQQIMEEGRLFAAHVPILSHFLGTVKDPADFPLRNGLLHDVEIHWATHRTPSGLVKRWFEYLHKHKLLVEREAYTRWSEYTSTDPEARNAHKNCLRQVSEFIESLKG